MYGDLPVKFLLDIVTPLKYFKQLFILRAFQLKIKVGINLSYNLINGIP
ncbi:hypothetical protein OENI_150011 [Oenococcus oeni]|uniref:Uncharacterized protein n=1 Tax=Oenococcus oeni TaxID=1247 RepID=A0AAQ2ZDQ5_OENOE|nr:hypothetical protein OENI_10014 [Oenococcus oeni]SYW02391.1 hypothetical protein OENI_350014 [Oenococcus oeni]SYW02463.1 hypothetical protein OENI_360008 [Oenococcus oeni]SYW02889.1 hypothetical protein OENI_150011 [Oenococcus oeni]SYW07081.1 hypothetical protein OENI_550007 [Oenococcus oeni]